MLSIQANKNDNETTSNLKKLQIEMTCLMIEISEITGRNFLEKETEWGHNHEGGVRWLPRC